MLSRARELEHRFADVLTVIGVHAGKYPAERRTANIRTACDRLGVDHPVVNDRHFRVWREYGVQAWPTIALVGADGVLVGTTAGEFETEALAGVIEEQAERYRRDGVLRPGERDFGEDPERPPAPLGALRYPGRALAAGDRLYVSDTGHERVLECALERDAGGAPERARVLRQWRAAAGPDGGETALREPQGLALAEGALYVADRAGGGVARVALQTGRAEWVLGEPAGGSALRSPWGLAALPGGRIAVTLAGSHQLAVLDPASGAFAVVAGTGREEIADGRAPRAALAQPTGVTLDGDVVFADCESSSVRELDLERDEVRTIIGSGLFDHGDRDGPQGEALLQHDEDVTAAWGKLVVADTYNDVLKVVDRTARRSDRMPGDAGDGAFRHPAGVSTDGSRVIVADVAHHRLCVVEGDGSVKELPVEEGS